MTFKYLVLTSKKTTLLQHTHLLVDAVYQVLAVYCKSLMKLINSLCE